MRTREVTRLDAADPEIQTEVERLDNAPVRLKKARKTAEGFYEIELYAARPGIMLYRNPDGSMRRELFPRDEAKRMDSLATLVGKPVTLKHPPRLLTPETAKQHTRGSITGGVIFDEEADRVKASALVTDAAAIKALDDGVRQVSVGYRQDIEFTSGVDPEFGEYDVIQRNKKYNHAAIVPEGRAGSGVSVRIDAADNEDSKAMKYAQLMFLLNAYRMDSEDNGPSFDAVKDGIKKLTEEKETVEAERDALQAQVDAQPSEEDQAKERMDWFDARMPVIAQAEAHGIEHAGKSTADVRKEVVLKAFDGKARMDGSDDYFQAFFDQLPESSKEDKKETVYEAFRGLAHGHTRQDSKEDSAPAKTPTQILLETYNKSRA